MTLKNTLNDDFLYCVKYEVAKEIDEQKFCVAYQDKECKTRPSLVNMEFWKPKNAKTK